MIKGVNRQVVEVKETECEYFERILFFVKPEYASLSEGKLRDRAGIIASGNAKTVPTKIKKNRLTDILRITFSTLCGIATGLSISILIQ